MCQLHFLPEWQTLKSLRNVNSLRDDGNIVKILVSNTPAESSVLPGTPTCQLRFPLSSPGIDKACEIIEMKGTLILYFY